MCSATQRLAQLFECADALGVVLAARPERLGELVMPAGLVLLAELLEGAREPVVGIVVGRRQLEHPPHLRFRLLVTLHAEVGDGERLADRGLVRLSALGLLERDARLSRHAVLQVRPALLEEVIGLAFAHANSRYGKASLPGEQRAR